MIRNIGIENIYSEIKISPLEQADFGVNNGKKNYVPHPHSPQKKPPTNKTQRKKDEAL